MIQVIQNRQINEDWLLNDAKLNLKIKRLESFDGFDGKNFFTWNKSFLSGVVSTFLTYFIILVQFKEADPEGTPATNITATNVTKTWKQQSHNCEYLSNLNLIYLVSGASYTASFESVVSNQFTFGSNCIETFNHQIVAGFSPTLRVLVIICSNDTIFCLYNE